MGVIAHGRQTMLDAGWLKRQWAAYEARGRTGKRPAADPCLEALWPALDGKLPVAFEADSADEIHRALDFAAEFKLKPIIVGGRNAWKVVDRLKAEQVPVILRLDFSTRGRPRIGPSRARSRGPRAVAAIGCRVRRGTAQGRREVRVHDTGIGRESVPRERAEGHRRRPADRRALWLP